MSGPVVKEMRGGKVVWRINFQYLSDGYTKRYRKDAQIQSFSAAKSEAQERMTRAHQTGDPRLPHEIPTVEPEPLPQAATVETYVAGDFTQVMSRFTRSTRLRYQSILKTDLLPRWGGSVLRDITPQQLEAWKTELASRIDPRQHLNLMRTVMRSAYSAGVIESLPHPWPRSKRPKKLFDAPSDDEVNLMLAHSTGPIRTAIALAALAGMRMGEIRALTVDKVDFIAGEIRITHAMSENEVSTTKSGHQRSAPLNSALRRELTLACKGKLPRALVCPTHRGKTWTRQSLLREFVTFLDRNGLRKRSFHSLRHYFVSELLRRGATIEVVRELAGHSSISVTNRYAHAVASERAQAVDLLDR